MADEPAEQLITVAEAREAFARTEPLGSAVFTTGQESREAPFITLGEKWTAFDQITDPVPAWLTVPETNTKYQLTFQAARQIGSTCTQPQNLQVSHPNWLHQQVVNWWLSDPEGLGERQLKLLLSPEPGQDEDGSPLPLAVAQTRATVQPFSNLALMDVVTGVIARKYSLAAARRAVVHFTMSHDLEHTDFRVLIPGEGVTVDGTDIDDDAWWPGVEVTNSCIGLKQTTVTGLMCREATMAVALDYAHAAGGFKRLRSTPSQAYDWAGESAGDVIDALGVSMSNVQALAKMPVGRDSGGFVNSLCKEFNVPKLQKQRITAILEQVPPGLTMYEMATTVARTANMDDLPWRTTAQLMTTAGHVIHSQGARCDKSRPCYRVLPPGFEMPDE